VTYNEAFELPIADLDAAERYGWEIAGPEAYPNPMRVNPGQSLRPPLTWELELLEGTLRAIPEFLARGERNATLTVPTAVGPLALELTRLDEMAP
jgi:hypothetical protein